MNLLVVTNLYPLRSSVATAAPLLISFGAFSSETTASGY